ncbi:MAG: hypothetical protein ACJ763_19040 [Bdellovibrionia bacterium]
MRHAFHKTNLLGGILMSLAISLAAVAALNSVERKATHEAQAVAKETAERVRKTCGNSKLEFQFDWFAFKDLDYTRGRMTRPEAMKMAGSRANRIGNAVIALCAESPKLKESLSHLTTIRLAPHDEAANFRIDVSRQDETLQAQFGAFGEVVTQDLIGDIRKQF